jgi:hypothetical protein
MAMQPRQWTRWALVLGTTLVLAACSSSDEVPSGIDEPDVNGIWAGNVVASPTAAGVHIQNNTTAPIGYMVFEKVFIMTSLARFGTCVDAVSCPAIAPGERKTIARNEITGYEPGAREAVVYWWHFVRGKDGALVADSIRSVAVGL